MSTITSSIFIWTTHMSNFRRHFPRNSTSYLWSDLCIAAKTASLDKEITKLNITYSIFFCLQNRFFGKKVSFTLPLERTKLVFSNRYKLFLIQLFKHQMLRIASNWIYTGQMLFLIKKWKKESTIFQNLLSDQELQALELNQLFDHFQNDNCLHS